MQLRTYLTDYATSYAEFAERIGVSAEAVRKWATGERMPRPENVDAIRRATGGRVMPVDWYQQEGNMR